MKIHGRRWVLIPLFLMLAVVCAGCDKFPNRNISTKLSLSSPIRLNQPVTATITADFSDDVPAVQVKLSGNSPSAQKLSVIRSWDLGDVPKDQHLELSTVITFAEPGYYRLVAGIETKLATYNNSELYLYVDQSGAVFNPTPIPTPGTRAPAQSPSPTAPVKTTLLIVR